MSRLTTIGTSRCLSSRYVEIKRDLKNTYRKSTLNDSGSLMNDNGKIK